MRHAATRRAVPSTLRLSRSGRMEPGRAPPQGAREIAWWASMAVFLLTGLDSHRQTILPGRQRARNKWRECARRIVGPVEVQYDCTVMGQPYIHKPAAAIGFSAGGQIAENDKENLGIEIG